MPVMETGLWLVIAVIGTAFTFFSIKMTDKASIAFHMIAIAMFAGLSAVHAGGYEVAATSTHMTYNETGDLVFNETNADVFLPGGTQGSWLSYLFMGFAIFNLFLIFKQVVRL